MPNRSGIGGGFEPINRCTNIHNHVLVIAAWARVAHVGYWHCSGLEPEGRRVVVYE
jgi:hypothetical protein